jgi:hypothetical protein
MRRFTKIVLGGVVAIAAIQVVTFDRTNPPVTADIVVAPDVKAVLQRACYDCHSNETTWPWYSRVAPVSWLLHRDVVEGRRKMNFSEWESLPADKRAKKQRKCGGEVAEGEMPPWFYMPLHPRAALSSADKELLQSWSRGASSPPEEGHEPPH